jgi:RNA polymerase sigma-70 factor, ECF subfamily
MADDSLAASLRDFERVYRETRGAVYALCLRMTRNAAQAQDCAQEAYVRAWQGFEAFEQRSAVRTWLHRIAVNVVLERRRREAARPVEVTDLSWPPEREASLPDTPVEVREIEAAVAALPPGARDVLVLCAIHGYSHGEAAGMLGIAEGTCKAQLHRARELLREKLDSPRPIVAVIGARRHG